jgi:hypothetical protein
MNERSQRTKFRAKKHEMPLAPQPWLVKMWPFRAVHQ